jgi:hypothetical protein
MQRAGGMLRCLLLAAAALRTASAPTWTECPGISHVKNGDCNSPKHPCRRGCGATNVGKTATLASRASLRGDRGDSPLHHRPAHPCTIAQFTPAPARCQRRARRCAMQCPDCPRGN